MSHATHEQTREFARVTHRIAAPVLHRRTPAGWFIGFFLGASLLMLLLISITMVLAYGVGVWGLNMPVSWAWDITNFVWWIGIGHAGTLISAILLLLRQQWRTSINRFAEAMTLFAVMCAGIFPVLHIGRHWKAYYLFPMPNTLDLWPQWRSPLMWDVVAVNTYGTVSLFFWYVGLIPDMATLRDQAKSPFFRFLYGVMSFGWRGSAAHWQRYQIAYLLLAGLATPLVVSVHTIVSFDFAVSIIPGWHATIFPPYFVAGAIYSGFAMVLTLCIPLREAFGFKDFISEHHLDVMAKVMLATGLIVGYGYGVEAFTAWYSANTYEQFMAQNRMFGPYWWAYWILILCNVVTPQLLWFKWVRITPWFLFIVAIIVNIGMWFERFVIIATSLHRDFLTSSWGMFHPTWWDIGLYVGTIGLFITLIFVFVRVLPSISIFEMRELVWHHAKEKQEMPPVGADAIMGRKSD